MSVRAGCVWGVVFALAFAASTRMNAQAAPTVAEQYLLSAANAERARAGVTPLRWDAALYAAAEAHVRQMAARQSISHRYEGEADLSERAQTAGAKFSVVAENVAEAPSAIRIHDAWMASPGHRANLLDARLNAVGIRVIVRNRELYAVQDFARVVEQRSLPEQEAQVAALIGRDGSIFATPGTAVARETCARDSGFAGSRKPGYVVRFTASELEQLPQVLVSQLSTGRFQRAEVGACGERDAGNFAAFRIAVLLYR